MDVLGYDDVAHQGKSVAVAYLAENLDEDISGSNRTKQGQTSITGERNEMQMAASVVTKEFVAHKRNEKSKPRPFKTERVGHPKKLNQSHGDEVLEWYHPAVLSRQEKSSRKGWPPASACRRQEK
ncbi:MAG: hypothetical protein WCA19_12490 [Candidatus Acidiferrales bacterium]